MARCCDHSIILYGSNMSNSNAHNQYPLPTAVLGGACGKIKGGQHLHYPEHTPLANLLLTMLHRAGYPMDKIGDSTGAVRGDLTMKRWIGSPLTAAWPRRRHRRRRRRRRWWTARRAGQDAAQALALIEQGADVNATSRRWHDAR